MIHFYLSQIAETSGMGVTRWINNYVREFPIPKTQGEDQAAIIKLVDQILSAKATSPNSDTSALERAIDQSVYSLYGLSPEETAIIEDACGESP